MPTGSCTCNSFKHQQTGSSHLAAARFLLASGINEGRTLFPIHQKSAPESRRFSGASSLFAFIFFEVFFADLDAAHLAADRFRQFVDEFDDARVLIRRGVRLDVFLNVFFQRVGAGQKDFKNAIPCLQKAEKADPKACLTTLEVCFRELGDFENAYRCACRLREM